MFLGFLYCRYSSHEHSFINNALPLKLILFFKEFLRDFSDGPLFQNLPSNAEDVGSIFGLETKILHATGQLTPHSSTAKPICSRAHALRQKPEGRNWREAPHCI